MRSNGQLYTQSAMSKPRRASRIAEWFIVAITAVVMSRIGYLFLSRVTDMDWSDWDDTKWVIWSCLVSAATWTIIWGLLCGCSRSVSVVSWLVAGALSPLLGCFIFFPATPWALGALVDHFHLIIPFGFFTGLIMYLAVFTGRRLIPSAAAVT